VAYETLLLEHDGPVALITINRPKALNALNRAVIEELIDCLERLAIDPGVRAVILTGAGEKAFVAGADISEMKDMGPDEASGFSSRGHNLGELLAEMPKIAIAAVNGFALGGGTELALACDFVYASENARFGQPEVNLGVIPGFGGTQRLARRVGSGRAMELVVTGDPISAADAHRIGIVNRVLPPAELLPAARATAQKIATRGPLAVAAAKRAVHAALQTTLAEGNQFEISAFAGCFATEDQKEGMAAFLQKRAAVFQGR
jgi:enoyl-CoA hydratase